AGGNTGGAAGSNQRRLASPLAPRSEPLGSTLVPSVGEGVPAFANFSEPPNPRPTGPPLPIYKTFTRQRNPLDPTLPHLRHTVPMKPLPSILASGLLALLPVVALAQNQPPPAAPADPFVKNQPDAAGKSDKLSWQNCFVVLEVYALDKNEAASVIENERGG